MFVETVLCSTSARRHEFLERTKLERRGVWFFLLFVFLNAFTYSWVGAGRSWRRSSWSRWLMQWVRPNGTEWKRETASSCKLLLKLIWQSESGQQQAEDIAWKYCAIQELAIVGKCVLRTIALTCFGFFLMYCIFAGSVSTTISCRICRNRLGICKICNCENCVQVKCCLWLLMQAGLRQQRVVAVARIDWKSAKLAAVRIKVVVVFAFWCILQTFSQLQSDQRVAGIDWKSREFDRVRLECWFWVLHFVSTAFFSVTTSWVICQNRSEIWRTWQSKTWMQILGCFNFVSAGLSSVTTSWVSCRTRSENYKLCECKIKTVYVLFIVWSFFCCFCRLFLSGNHLSELPETIGILQNLIEWVFGGECVLLRLNCSGFLSPSISWASCRNLLEICRTWHGETFCRIFDFSQLFLFRLNLQSNLLKEFPESIGSLQKLKQWAFFSVWMFLNTEFGSVFLNHNQLIELSESIFQLKRVETWVYFSF